MEDGLVLILYLLMRLISLSLNPCCDGRWSRTTACRPIVAKKYVLILVVMEDGLVPKLTEALPLLAISS